MSAVSRSCGFPTTPERSTDPIMNVQSLGEKKFTHCNTVCSFNVFRLLESGQQPTALFGKEGDLVLDGDCTWVRYGEGWRKSIEGRDEKGIVRQRHPKITGRCLVGTDWKFVKGNPRGKNSLHQISDVQTHGHQPLFYIPCVIKSDIKPQQEWIEKIRREWDAPSISVIPKLHEVGKRIIEKLLDAGTMLPANPIDDSLVLLLGRPKRTSVPPSIRLVLTDILQAKDPNVTEFISRASEVGIGALDVIASMMNPTTYCNMESSERRLYGALDIPVTKDGLGLCGYAVKRYKNGKENYVPRKEWTTTFTPPGSITHTHMDFYGRYQYMVHLFGHKLWLLWPPTPKNLKRLWSSHTQYTDSDMTERCMDEMEGLQVFYATEEQVFVIKPNVLHACISVGTCAHSATWFWRLETYQDSLRMVEWGLDWLRAKVSSDAPRQDYEEGLEAVESEMKVWREMVKRNRDMKDLRIETERLDKFLKEVVGLFKPVEVWKDGRITKGKKRMREE